MELSFEYLMAKNKLQWIAISSEHAMLMSVCLQSIVDELLNQKDGHDLRQDVDSVGSFWNIYFPTFFLNISIKKKFQIFLSTIFLHIFLSTIVMKNLFVIHNRNSQTDDQHHHNLFRC